MLIRAVVGRPARTTLMGQRAGRGTFARGGPNPVPAGGAPHRSGRWGDPLAMSVVVAASAFRLPHAVDSRSDCRTSQPSVPVARATVLARDLVAA